MEQALGLIRGRGPRITEQCFLQGTECVFDVRQGWYAVPRGGMGLSSEELLSARPDQELGRVRRVRRDPRPFHSELLHREEIPRTQTLARCLHEGLFVLEPLEKIDPGAHPSLGLTVAELPFCRGHTSRALLHEAQGTRA